MKIVGVVNKLFNKFNVEKNSSLFRTWCLVTSQVVALSAPKSYPLFLGP